MLLSSVRSTYPPQYDSTNLSSIYNYLGLSRDIPCNQEILHSITFEKSKITATKKIAVGDLAKLSSISPVSIKWTIKG